MIRYTIFVMVVLGSAATAIAAIAPAASLRLPSHTTVVIKNQAFPVFGPVIVESCMNEDCSDAGT